MYDCAMTAGKAAVNIFSDVDLFPFLQKMEKSCFLPELLITKSIVNTNYCLKYRNDEEREVRFANQSIEVLFPWELMKNGETLLYLAYSLCEIQNQERGIITSHCAAFSDGNYSHLVFGEKGAGKTSVILDLCSNFGYKLIGNDLCLIGDNNNRLSVIGGTKFFFLRKESVSRNLPELGGLFSNKNVDPWLNKILVEPERVCVKKEIDILPLAKVFLVHVDETKSEDGFYTQNRKDLNTKLYLNENFSRYIRNTTSAILGGEDYEFLYYLPSFDTSRYFEKRKRIIDLLINNIGICYVSGNLKQVTAFIKESIISL